MGLQQIEHRNTMYATTSSEVDMVKASDNADRAWISQLRKGLVEFLVLAALKQQEAYGYELLQRLAALDGLTLTESTLYPLLARLSEEEYVTARQEPSPDGPPRRYYRLTASGRQRLKEMLLYWKRIVASIENLTMGGPT
jgi:PadR family transcriptional regulator, regulatory protein PadR